MVSKEVFNALENLEHELSKLEPAIKHVETALLITETVKGIPQKHVQLLNEVKDNDDRHKSELKELFEKELTGITDENRRLSNITSEILKMAENELEALDKLKNTIKSFHDRVEGINFPEKLDKLDANVAGIMAAIQSVQSRLDSLERNIIDRLKDGADRQKEAFENFKIIQNTHFENSANIQKESFRVVQQNMEAANKRQQLFSYITWGLIVIIIVIIIW